MRTAIIIPARLQSRRLPNKPLADLGGIPMVVRVAQRAAQCRAADMVAIATDAPAIAAAAERHGFRAVRTASGHRSGTDRVAEAAALLDAEAVINLQGDEPFIEPADLQAICVALQKPTADVVTLKQPLALAAAADPSVVKVVCRDDGQALYFSRAAVPYCRPAAKGFVPSVFGHIGVYGCRRVALDRWQRAPAHALEICEGLEQLRALAIGMQILVLPAQSRGRGIDTPADLQWARRQLKGDDATA